MQAYRNSTKVSACYLASLRQGKTQLKLTKLNKRYTRPYTLKYEYVNDGSMTL